MLSKKVDAAGVEAWIAEYAGDRDDEFDTVEAAEAWLHHRFAEQADKAALAAAEVRLLVHELRHCDFLDEDDVGRLIERRVDELHTMVFMLGQNGPLTLLASPHAEHRTMADVGGQAVKPLPEDLAVAAEERWREASAKNTLVVRERLRAHADAEARRKNFLDIVSSWLEEDRPGVIESGLNMALVSLHVHKLPGYEQLKAAAAAGQPLPEALAATYRAAVLKLHDAIVRARDGVAAELDEATERAQRVARAQRRRKAG
jgi:hypothetical protein